MRKKKIVFSAVLILTVLALGLTVADTHGIEKIVLSAQQKMSTDENSDTTLPAGKGKEIIKLPEYRAAIQPHDFVNNKIVKTVYIPKRVHTIYNSGMGAFPFTNCPNLSDIHVDKENTVLYSVNGVLLKKLKKLTEDGKQVTVKQLVRYPQAKTERNYEIPEGTQELYTYGFRDAVALKNVTIPKSMTSVLEGTEFTGCKNLQAFQVDKANKKYKSVDGIVYSKDMSKICLYPEGKQDKSFTLPKEVKKITLNVFDNSKFEKLVISNDKIQIDGGALPETDKFTIYCNPGSNAQAYALKYKIPCHLLKSPKPSVSLPYKTIAVEKGKKAKLDYNLKHTKKTPKFKSSNTKIAKVSSSGIITGVKPGKCIIKVSLNNQTPLKCKIVVPSRYHSAKKVKLKAKEKTLQFAQTYSMGASIYPKNASDCAIYYKSSNSSVASVDQKGRITAVGNGTASITAKTRNGKTAVCRVKVTARPISVRGKDIRIGDSLEQLKKALGNPDRIDEDARGMKLYVYNGDIKRLAIIGVMDKRVTSIYTDSSDFKYYGITRGSTQSDIKDKTGFGSSNSGETLIKEKNITAVFYKDNNADGNEVFAVKVYSNILNNGLTLRRQNIYDGYERQMFDLINSFRSHYGIDSLTWSEKAHNAAKEHSADMSLNGYMGHISPDGSDPKSRMEAAGVQSTAYVENCAMSSYDAIQAFMAWVQHGPHKEAMLKKNYNYMGIGNYYRNSSTTTYYTMNIYR